MPPGKGVTISVTAETDAGKRRHMEDYLDVRLSPNEALQSIPDLRDQAFVGVFDGHGGKEAAIYARDKLWDVIQKQEKFRSTDCERVKEALKDAYLELHREMEPLRATWKRNKLGDLSTAGTTACTVIFRQDHFFVANVGDSSAVLAWQDEEKASSGGQSQDSSLTATMLTKDHKPGDPEEARQIEDLGGQVKISRRGVPRVVWERKKPDSPPGQDSEVNLIPFLSVSRSLGDYWSWNQQTQKFVVSPEPDVSMHPLDTSTHRFIVVASDGLWNVMTPQEVVDFVWAYETKGEEEEEEEEGEGGEGEKHHQTRDVVRALIDEALYRWLCRGMCADNIAVVITFLTEGALPSFAGSKFGQSAAASKPSSTCCPESPASRQPTADQPSPSPPAVIHHVHTSSSGSTLYHKETRDGMCFEEHVRVSLRCRRKDKQRLKEKQRKRFHGMQGPGDEGEGEGEGTKETLPQKRQRLEKASILLPSRSYSDRDSGCESGSERREATTTEISVHPLSIPISSPSVSTPSSPLPAPSSLVSVPCSSVSTSSSPIPVPASSVSGAGEGSSGMESSPDTISPSHSPPPAMDCLPMPPADLTASVIRA